MMHNKEAQTKVYSIEEQYSVTGMRCLEIYA